MGGHVVSKQSSLRDPLLRCAAETDDEKHPSPSTTSTEPPVLSPEQTTSSSVGILYDDIPASDAETVPSFDRPRLLAQAGPTKLATLSVLTNTFLGGTILSTPWLCAELGIPMFLLCLLGFCLLCTFSMLLLIALALRAPSHTETSFTSLLRLGFPQQPIVHCAGDLIIVLKCIGLGCSTLIVIGDTVPALLGSSPPWMSQELHRNIVILVTTICLILPASLPKRIRSLRFTNYVSILCLLYVTILVFAAACGASSLMTDPQRTSEAPFPANVNTALRSEFSTEPPPRLPFQAFLRMAPVFILMFTGAQNLLSLFNEMRQTRRISALRRVTMVSVMLTFTVYVIIGVFGYIACGRFVTSDVLKQLDSANIYVWFAKLMIAMSAIFSFPLQCHPFRRSLWVIRNTTWKSSPAQDSPVHLHNNETARSCERRFLRIATFAYMCLTATLALFIYDLGLVFQLIGVAGSISLSFIIPSAAFLSVSRLETPSLMRAGAGALVILSVIFIPMAFVAIIAVDIH